MTMGKCVLLNPKTGKCDECGRTRNIRDFIRNNIHYSVCSTCWNLYLDECGVSLSKWSIVVSKEWDNDLNLVFETLNSESV